MHAEELVQKTQSEAIHANSCFEFPTQIPAVFTFPLKSRHTHHETPGSVPIVPSPPAERKPGSYAGFWVALCLL